MFIQSGDETIVWRSTVPKHHNNTPRPIFTAKLVCTRKISGTKFFGNQYFESIDYQKRFSPLHLHSFLRATKLHVAGRMSHTPGLGTNILLGPIRHKVSKRPSFWIQIILILTFIKAFYLLSHNSSRNQTLLPNNSVCHCVCRIICE